MHQPSVPGPAWAVPEPNFHHRMAVARSPSPPKPENTPDMRWDTLEQISQEITEIARSAKISPVAKSQYYYLYRLAVEQIRTIDNLEPGKHSGEGTRDLPAETPYEAPECYDNPNSFLPPFHMTRLEEGPEWWTPIFQLDGSQAIQSCWHNAHGHNVPFPALPPSNISLPSLEANLHNVTLPEAGQTWAEKEPDAVLQAMIMNRPKRNRQRRRSYANSKLGRVCSHCQTTDTPEWRRGPDGDHSLCNACGLHYAKLLRQGVPPENQTPKRPARPNPHPESEALSSCFFVPPPVPRVESSGANSLLAARYRNM